MTDRASDSAAAVRSAVESAGATVPLPTTPVAPERPVTATQPLSESRILGSGPLTGFLRAADLQDKMLGEFKLLRRLGVGGMAEVWLAEQTSLKRQVAVKVMRPDVQSDDLCRRRFEQEAHAAAGLNHPNIVQVYGIGETDGIRYIAQEYVHGMNMRDYIAKKGPPPWPIALHILKQVASALQAAAEAGIVHRDIKPENILLTRKGQAKVADFGLAQLTQVSDNVRLTQIGMTMGTPLYMSPEQVQGKKVDHRSDVYSLGVTFYHLLGGRPPFRGETAMSVAIQHVQNDAPRLHEIRADLPRPLCDVIHRMMAKKPELRIPSAQDLSRELRKIDKYVAQDVELTESGDLIAAGRASLNAGPLWQDLARWVHPAVHPLSAFIVWSAGIGSVAWIVGSVSRPGDSVPPRSARPAHADKQPTVQEQLAFARQQNTEDAWRAVLTLFPGDAAEKHEARAELIHRLLPELRLHEAETLCREVTASREAPPGALAVAWAGLTIIEGLRGNQSETLRLMDQSVRPREPLLPSDLRAWTHEVVDRLIGDSPPRGLNGNGPLGPERNRPPFGPNIRPQDGPPAEDSRPGNR